MKGDETADRNANAAIVRAYALAWQDGGLATLVGFHHDEFVLHYFGQSQLAGDHVGKPAALAALAKVRQLTNRKLIKCWVYDDDQRAADEFWSA